MGNPSMRVQLERALKAAGNPERAAFVARYFKTVMQLSTLHLRSGRRCLWVNLRKSFITLV
jgi:hypothetical protein